MINIDLEKLHKIQLEMAKDFKKICEQENISYFLIGGTLLGAVRHKGFIPWDDDLDIGMLREDFEKFLEVCRDKLPSNYFLQTLDTDPEFGLPIAKLRKNMTLFVEHASAKVDMHSGIYIDIFPYDNVPDNIFFMIYQRAITYILKRLVLLKSYYNLKKQENIFKIMIINLLVIVCSFIPKKRMINIYLREIKRFNNIKDTQYLTNFGGSYSYNKEKIQRVWLNKLIRLKFENEQFNVPSQYHSMLKSIYGNYMELPPENARYNRHGIIKIDFGDEL